MSEIVPMNKGMNKKIAFIFSCSGKEEEKTGKVVSGRTGNNSFQLIQIIRQSYNSHYYFDWDDGYNYRITNASNRK